MSQKNVSIIIVESSQIVFEGLFSVLTKSGQSFQIYRADSLSELQVLGSRVDADFIFINPGLIQNQSKDFMSIKKEFETSIWIGIVYAFIEPQLLSTFDELLYINDSSNKVLSMISTLLLVRKSAEGGVVHLESLSEREIDVLKLLVEGNANKEIADKLNISTHTVISHRKNIAQKTGIKSVAGLTIYAVVNKIIAIDGYRE